MAINAVPISNSSRVLKEVKNTIFVLVGILSAGMGIKGFLLSSHFIDGGVTGISMLINSITGISLPLLLLLINVPFIIIGYRQMGTKFAFKSSLAIAGLSLCLAFMPYPDITPDLLLTSVFGGFFIGLGIGLAMRGGVVLDGTDIAALLISKKSHLLKVSDVILLLNVLIFSTAAFFLGIEKALYSILTYFAASKTIEYIINGIDEYTGVTIVTAESDKIVEFIVDEMNRGVTLYSGKRGYGTRGESNIDSEIIFTVITRLEIGRLQTEINRIDPHAFVVQHSVNDIHGGIVKKLPLH
ncbi:MAG: YitT family protein [Flavisolibacter sp.]